MANSLRGRLMASTLLFGSFCGVTPLLAQEPAVDAAAAQAPTPADAETIVVTGSRIARPNLESTIPVASVSGTEFFQTSQLSVGDVLNELPQLRSTFSQQNSTQFLGTHGLNLLDLRGLGTQRTLVLVNGRRHVGADVLSNAVSPDTNTFPTDLIERVDLVTGGNSAVYGSDAIAGVVNFVLKQDYEGVQARAQTGISQYGDGASHYLSLLAGQNFAEGRGNIAINLEYARQDAFYGANRPNARNNNNFVVVDTDPANSPNGSDGVPDRLFFRDIRSATISNGGQIGFASPTGACGRDALGAAYTCGYVFMPDGSLVPQTGQRVGLAPNGSYIGGNGDNLRDGKQLVLQPQLNRYAANLIGHFEVSQALVPFVEAKYVRTTVTGSVSGPAFFQGSTLDANLERPRVGNPYLTDQARATIIQQLQAANPDAEITDDTRFQLRKNLTDLGVRNERTRRETYRIVAGVRGTFNDDWTYEVSGNYGEFKERNRIEGNLNVQRYLLAMDTTRDSTGAIVCRSRVDPSAGAEAELVDDAGVLANDISACVPLNPFGTGNISDAARNYVIQDTIATGKITQLVGSANMAGDSSQWFELPGGPLGFAIGAEYRRETAFYRQDPLVTAGYTFYNSIPAFDPPSFEVKEIYGELRAPLLANLPFIRELTVSGSGRIADYKGGAGTVYAYSGGVDWRPIDDLHLRANYSRAVRAPNLTDLYTAQGQNFTPAPNDPCSARNIGTGSATRAANCAAAGRPADYDYVYTASLEYVSGGNPDLKAEKSNSYTFGGVFTPSFIPGLSVSVDYFKIVVDDVITSPSAQQILNACYDAADLNNQFCALFQRAGAGGGPNGEVPFQVLEGSLQATLLNYAKLKTRGIDTEVSYRHNFGNVLVSGRLNYTHMFQRDEYLNPVDPGRANQRLYELGDPKDQVNLNLDAKFGRVTIGYQMRYIGRMVLNAYEDTFSKQGRAPENADYADRRFYPDVFYHDIRVGVDATERFNIYGGVDNIGNRMPPLGLTGAGGSGPTETQGGAAIYDVRGRSFYVGVVAKF